MGKKASRHQHCDGDQFVKCPMSIVKCGKALSHAAVRVFLVISSYNPARPGIRRIAREAGMSKSTVELCLQELIDARILIKHSGKADYVANNYDFYKPKDWLLYDLMGVPTVRTPRPRKRPAKRDTGVLNSGTGGVPNSGKELDQLKIDQLITGPAGHNASRQCVLADSSGSPPTPLRGEDRKKGFVPDRPENIPRQATKEVSTLIDGVEAAEMENKKVRGHGTSDLAGRANYGSPLL